MAEVQLPGWLSNSLDRILSSLTTNLHAVTQAIDRVGMRGGGGGFPVPMPSRPPFGPSGFAGGPPLHSGDSGGHGTSGHYPFGMGMGMMGHMPYGVMGPYGMMGGMLHSRLGSAGGGFFSNSGWGRGGGGDGVLTVLYKIYNLLERRLPQGKDEKDSANQGTGQPGTKPTSSGSPPAGPIPWPPKDPSQASWLDKIKKGVADWIAKRTGKSTADWAKGASPEAAAEVTEGQEAAGAEAAAGAAPGAGALSAALAIKRAIDEKFGNLKRGLGESGQHFLSAMTTQRAGQATGNVAAGVGKGLGSTVEFFAGREAGGVVEAPFRLAEALLKSVERLREWNELLHQANVRFADFSGPMAAVDIRQQVRDIQLSRERGSRRAESAEYLAQRKHRLEEELAPIEDWIANIQNYVTGFIDEKVAELVPYLKAMMKSLEILTGVKIEDPNRNKDNAFEWTKEAAEMFSGDKRNQPARFR